MTIRDDRFDSHPLGDTLGAIGSSSEAVAEIHPEDERVQRVAHVARVVAALVTGIDRQLVTPTMLDALQASAVGLRDTLSAFQQDGVETRLDDAAVWADRVLDSLGTWPLSVPADIVVRSAIEEIARMAEATASRVEGRASAVEIAAGRAVNAVEEVKAEAASSISTVEQQAQVFNAAIDARLTDLVPTIEAQKARLDTAITEFQGQFSSAEEARRVAAEAERRALTVQTDEWIHEERTKVDVATQGFMVDAQELLEQIEAYRSQAVKVTQAIGVAGMAEGFRADADEQKANADRLRYLAIGALVAAVGATFWTAATTHSDDFNASVFGARALLTAAIGSVAAYAIIQSQQHRERERQSRKLAIEFASIDPYLALMPEADQVAIKKKLAEAWFGRPMAPLEVESGAMAASIPAATLIDALLKYASK